MNSEQDQASRWIASSIVSQTTGERQRLFVVFVALSTLGLALAALNIHLPLVRNSFIYANISLALLHDSIATVAQNASVTNGKPVLFSVVALPWVRLLGINSGLIATSALCTVFFLWEGVLVVRRLGDRLQLDETSQTWAFIFLSLNPLVQYQFWSSYPDSLFAGLTLTAFLLTDKIAVDASRHTNIRSICLCLVILAAIHTRHIGLVLLGACPCYLFLLRRQLQPREPYRWSFVILLSVVFVVALGVVILAKLRIYPLLDFDAGSNYELYTSILDGARLQAIFESTYLVLFSFFFLFHFSLIFLLLAVGRRLILIAPQAVFAMIYIAAVLLFPGTPGNQRYLLPVLPFIALMLSVGVHTLRQNPRRAILVAYLVVAIGLTLVFNVSFLWRIAAPSAAKTLDEHARLRLWMDNLRIAEHLDLERQIRDINSNVPDGRTLYWVSSYYGFATHHFTQHLGIKGSLSIRTALFPSNIHPQSEPLWVVQLPPDPTLWPSPRWAHATIVGHGLFRLDPLFLKCALDANGTSLRVSAFYGEMLNIHSVSFYLNGKQQTFDSHAPFELTIDHAAPSRNEISGQAYTREGRILDLSAISCYTDSAISEREVASLPDVAHESANGSVSFERGSLLIDAGVSAIRFNSITVDRQARIADAHIEVTAAESTNEHISLEIFAEFSGDARELLSEKKDLSLRPKTQTVVKWSIDSWIAGHTYQSPNLAALLEEISMHSKWQHGNAVLILLRGSKLTLKAPDLEISTGVPKLYIQTEI